MDDLLLDEEFNNSSALDNNKDIAAANKIRMEINESTAAIRATKVVFMVLIGLQILAVIIATNTSNYTIGVEAIMIEGGILLGVYSLSIFIMKKNAKAGIMIGFGIYILMILLNAFVEPATLIRGFIIKGAVLYYMIRGLSHAFSLTSKVDQLKNLYYTKEDEELINSYQELPKIHYLKPTE